MQHETPSDIETSIPVVASRRGLLQAATMGAIGLGSALAGIQKGRAQAPAFTLPPATEAVTTFQVAFRSATLDDLKRRLAATRWPERETVTDESQGMPLAKMQALVGFWRSRYDLRRVEKRLNAFPQYRTQINGLGIHFLHVRSKHKNALPILLTHGWPGSVVEFLKVIKPLTDPTAHGGKPRTPSTSSCPRCRASASPTSRPIKAGTLFVSPRPG
jgi:epoxide hydrolase